jgi:hypothetical protein
MAIHVNANRPAICQPSGPKHSQTPKTVSAIDGLGHINLATILRVSSQLAIAFRWLPAMEPRHCRAQWTMPRKVFIPQDRLTVDTPPTCLRVITPTFRVQQ